MQPSCRPMFFHEERGKQTCCTEPGAERNPDSKLHSGLRLLGGSAPQPLMLKGQSRRTSPESRLGSPGLPWGGSCPLMPTARLPSLAGNCDPQSQARCLRTNKSNAANELRHLLLLQRLKPGVCHASQHTPTHTSRVSRAQGRRAWGLFGGAHGSRKTLVTTNRAASRGRQRIAWIY